MLSPSNLARVRLSEIEVVSFLDADTLSTGQRTLGHLNFASLPRAHRLLVTSVPVFFL